jgi:two-component system sensor histidine kinase UhpB
MAALDRTGQGNFDTRLPETAPPSSPASPRPSTAWPASLDQAVAENVRLTQQQAVARTITERLEADRRAIARELHDELGQSITAVAALAGAIVQRSTDNPAVSQSAEVIRDVASRMQGDVRALLTRLRPPTAGSRETLDDAVRSYLAAWRPATRTSSCPPSSSPAPIRCPTTSPWPPCASCRSRAPTSSATPWPAASGCACCARNPLTIEVSDNGRGILPATGQAGFGLTGMRERVAAVAGSSTSAAPRRRHASAPACPCPRWPLPPRRPARSPGAALSRHSH